MSKLHFYAVRYTGGNKTCTTGNPNKRTKRYSVAISVSSFLTMEARRQWVRDARWSGEQAGQREAVTKVKLRKLLAGLTRAEFNDFLYLVKVYDDTI